MSTNIIPRPQKLRKMAKKKPQAAQAVQATQTTNTSMSNSRTGEDQTDQSKLADRRFVTDKEYPPRFSLKDIEVEIGTWMCFAGREDTLLLSIHGACITANNVPCSSFGLYYGLHNLHNVSHAISGKTHTNQTAILTACLRALRNATFIMDERLKMASSRKDLAPLRTFIIKTDSEYLVRGITEWLPKWKEAGWKTCKGVTIANADLFQLVEAGIVVLERVVEVKFWLVPKENNQEAESLAKWAIVH
ncbi:uncharacterized protein N7511_008918 [Penicillium nucicola]|uniref:uncharacterized protein n=1 Tax=Penicillium nucicola TaxID=1850975 RepID=UPI002544FBF9|nr:uncharacterized protein N7511_008918 [Penicillium nucicola]KAJ5747222.1 hypothetical protein N7511_008918 [Penicillium nucicola]